MVKLPGPLTKWTTPKLLVIHDARLGVLYWTLRICVVIYILVSVFQSGSYRWSEKPDGSPTFWFESGNLYAAQNVSQPYCSSSDYNYQFKQDKASYWNDLDIDCRAAHYGEVLTKSATNAFIMTYMKEDQTSSRQCLPSEDVCVSKTLSAGERFSSQRRTKSFLGKHATCTCSKVKDYFVHGAEEIELHIEHAFWATQKMNIAGSSTYKEGSAEGMEKEEKNQKKNIKTCLKKKGMEEDECFKEFGPGETMSLTVAEWMGLAGVSLDERLKDTVSTDKVTNVFPHRRLVGSTLQIHLKYRGDAKDEVFTCDVEVQNKDGWTSIGSDLAYQNYKSHGQMDFFDRYRRGVQVEFYAMGEITKFDYVTMMNTIVTGLVLLGVVEHIVRTVALFALPESPVYTRAQAEPFKHKKAMATFGVNTALACQAFKAWDTSERKPGETASISEKELKAVYSGFFKDEVAGHFVDVVMAEARENGQENEGDNLSCQDLVHIMSTGLVSVEELQKFKEKMGDSNKVSPES